MTPVVFIHPPTGEARGQRSTLIKQPDLVPTLAYLTGVPIPRNSLGIASKTDLIHKEDLTDVYAYNAFQMSKCAKKQSSGMVEPDLEDLLLSWGKGGPVKTSDLEMSLIRMVSSLEDNLVDYNVPAIVSGITIVLLVSKLNYNIVYSKVYGKLLLFNN